MSPSVLGWRPLALVGFASCRENANVPGEVQVESVAEETKNTTKPASGSGFSKSMRESSKNHPKP